jgi:glycosyltransferase involved in cell wall biosynthesis
VTAVGDGPFRARLQQIADGLDVHFVGFQQRVGPYYEEADIFVNSSLGPEGMPMVAMEAMARSLPCILSDLPVHREIAWEAQAAALFEGGNAADLARTLSALINNEGLRLKYAEAGYRTVKLNHNPEYAAEAYARAFGLMDDVGEFAIADAGSA